MKKGNFPTIFQIETEFDRIWREYGEKIDKPFMEEVAKGVWKVETERIKILGGQGFHDEIAKLFEEYGSK